MNNIQQTVLITGATSGIGYELARLFAQKKYNLVLVARRQERLEEMARKFRNQHGIFVKIVACDLSKKKSVNDLIMRLEQDKIEITMLINNAGFGLFGRFDQLDKAEQLEMINLNVSALVNLTHACIPGMLQRKQGKILNVASTAGFLSGPYMAVYYATKNFVLSFSEAITEELAGTGISVTTLCPGPTRTEFPQRAGVEHSKIFKGNLTDAIQVAQAAYEGMMKGERLVFVNTMSKLSVNLPRFIPRSWTTKLVKRLQQTKEA